MLVLWFGLLTPVVMGAVVPAGTSYAPPEPIGEGTGNAQYTVTDADQYVQKEVTKQGNYEDCRFVEKIEYVDECQPYTEKTCYTQQKEVCKDQFEKNCTAVIDSQANRECFNVTELICQLAETIEYEMVDETFTVQKCSRVSDRICDTVYDLAVSTKDDFQCIDVDYQYCWDEEKIVKDRTCVFSADFECTKSMSGVTHCNRIPTKKCYDTPRKVKQLNCKPKQTKWCEKFTNEFPMPIEKQNCHNEPMKKCDLEIRTRPKKAKKYVYVKECKPVNRQVCDDTTSKKLRPVCDRVQKNICSYAPEEKCTEEPKKYCYKVEKRREEKICQPKKQVEFYEESQADSPYQFPQGGGYNSD